MVNTYRLVVEYDGTRYHGWQPQTNARTVGGEVHRAATACGLDVVELGGSGRTDAGVHALAQVAHLRVNGSIDAARTRMRMNDALPADIHLLDLSAAPSRFHARHDAVSRSYLYQISRRRSAFAKRWVWWVRDALDTAGMTAAAEQLVGRHDFARFCERAAEQTSTIVVMERIEIVEAGGLVLVRLQASHFLWKMVRRLVGTLVRVGTGQIDVAQFAALLDPRAPLPGTEGPAKWTAPSAGLFLEAVRYTGDPLPGPVAPAIPVPAEGPRAAAPDGKPRRPGNPRHLPARSSRSKLPRRR